jgi:hypothetical protein
MADCLPDFPRYICQRDNEWQGADHPDGPWRPIPALQSGLPWPVPSAPQPTPLSPAAQAIVKVFDDRYEMLGPLEDDWQEQCIAAALRAVADQVVPREPIKDRTWVGEAYKQRQETRAYLLAIAAELEGSNA